MKNPGFVYHRPDTLAEALQLLDELGEDAKVLAGGQSLLPTMALRLGPPAYLIDINRLPGLGAITVDDSSARIGALVRHAQAERSDELAAAAPLVHAAMPHIGHRAIRSQGTVVGSVAHADPAAEMPAVCLATDATMVATSTAGTREIAATDFAQGYLTTALRANELLTEIRFPAWPSSAGGAVVEVARRHGDYALVGLACAVDAPDGTIASAALAFFGVASTPVRVAEAEAALVGTELGDPVAVDAAIEAAAEAVTSTLEPTADIHATANHRRHLAGVLTRRGLAQVAGSIGVPA